MQVRIGILNPTSVRNKADSLIEHMSQHNLQYLCLAETNATHDIQKRLTGQFRRAQARSLWSSPVQPQQTAENVECERGKSGGVGLLTTRPARHRIIPPDDIMNISNRAMFTITRLGQIQFQLVVCYGFPQNFSAAKDHTNQLLLEVFSNVAGLDLPFLVVGDFNADVRKLPTWANWERLGAKDLRLLHQDLFHRDMPPTCKAVTWPDNAIVCPVMQQNVKNIQVLPADTFPTHAPVIVTLHSEHQQPMYPKLSMPKTFLDFPVTTNMLEAAANEVDPPTSLTLENWGQYLESVVDTAMRTNAQQDNQHITPEHLPRSYKGRCIPREPVLKPQPTVAKQGRAGEYQLQGEVLTFGAKARLKQYRRIQSLHHQPIAHQKDNEDKWYRCQQGLEGEWSTILASHAFGPPFHQWLREHPDIGFAMWPLPLQDWLSHVKQLVKFSLDSFLADDRLFLRRIQQYKREAEQKRGSKAHFAYVRNANKQSLQELNQPYQAHCSAHWSSESTVVLNLEPHQIDLGTPIYVQEVKGWVISTYDEKITVQLVDQDEPIQRTDTVDVSQTCTLSDPNEIASELSRYWMPIWHSSEEPTQEQIEHFRTLVDRLPVRLATLDIDDSAQAWQSAIHRVKGGTARGFDGVTAWELKTLPVCLITLLATTMLSYPNGYPPWFMRSRTFPVAKTDTTPTSQQIRPITVLPLLYRIYASMLCSQVLRYWGRTLPLTLKGLLPGRGSRDAAFHAQTQLESAHFNGQSLSGVTLDLQKCFNLVWHHVCEPLLLALGIPQQYIHRWIGSNSVLTRYWEVHGFTPPGDSRKEIPIVS